ncbi:MAG: DUF1849 family protein [Alphaproteobacteria bacterium]|nr:DUF1849 family protein [Alphaproteobacteria bacterium]
MLDRLVLLVVAVLGLTMPAALSAEARLASHRAVYVLTLGTAKANGVAAVEGAMSLDWQETCDGWTMAQRMRFQLFDSDGESIDNDITFSSWESRDGLSYRFTMRTLRNGEVADELRGRATLDGRGKGGKAVFTLPENEILELPPGTLFPTEHTLELIDGAKAGRRTLTRPVFDGASVEGAMEVNAVIAAVAAAEAAVPGAGKAAELVNGPSWRVRMAFFRMDDQRGSEPEYETTLRVFGNGVGTDFLFDYQEFSIKARLERLEMVPPPRC